MDVRKNPASATDVAESPLTLTDEDMSTVQLDRRSFLWRAITTGSVVAGAALTTACPGTDSDGSSDGDVAPTDSDGSDAAPTDSDGGDAAPADSDGSDAAPADSDGGDAAPADSDGGDAAPADSDGGDAAPADSDGSDSDSDRSDSDSR